MPQYPEDQTNGRMFTRHWVGEPKWLLASQSEFDGLAPSQIVRYANAEDRGFGDTESQFEVPARLDATPDADNLETNQRATEFDAKGVTVDAHRYVVDPLVEQHQYVGLYTAGPVRHVEEQVRDGTHKRIQQVLTRTFCAGHGYFVDELGRYHPVWKTAGGGWTGVNPDKKQVVYAREDDGSDSDSDMDETLPADFTPDMVREFATADEALMAHRPWLESKLSPYMALHPESFPNTFVREVYWREFTHESIAALEELGSDRARLEKVVAYHFTEKVAPQVLDAHCRLDPQTNTVIFVCSLMYVELGEPQTPDDLLDLPCIVAPCTRETLRMFGWNQLRDGEGYRYTHVFKWPRLKDTPEVRRALEFVQDNHIVRDGSDSDSDGDGESWIVALLRKHSMNYPQNPGWVDQGVDGTDLNHYEDVHDVTRNTTQADRTGRLTTLAEAPRGENPNATTQTWKTKDNNTYKTVVQFYRIAQQKCDIEQDGSLSFSIVLQKTEWHGADDGDNYEDGGTRQLASVSASEGWGKAEHRVIPSVPRENAIPTLLGIHGSTYRLVVEKRQTEGEGGHSDVSFQEFPLYNYGATSGPDDPVQTPPNVYNLLSGFDAVRQGYDPYPRPSYHVTYERVAPDSVGPLINKIKGLMGGDPAIDVVYHPEGYYTISARGTGKTPRHIEEWLVSANWFQHRTVEQWLGVTLGTKGGDGQDANERGFYDTITVNDQGVEVKSGWHSIFGIRGDLDADWMGSETSSADKLYVSKGASDSKEEVSFSHGDSHGHWASMLISSDPDDVGGNGYAGADGADSADKTRSHAITTVHPSINQDGTWNFSIERTYPHQRAWAWKGREAKRKGDWRDVYYVQYAHWPSRHAIEQDLLKNFASWAASTFGENVDLTGDDWSYSLSPTVDEFGLVKAGVLIRPVIWNKRGRNKHKDPVIPNTTEKYYYYKWKTQPNQPGVAKTDPWSAEQKPPFAPMLGFYFCVERGGIAYGTYDSLAKAMVAYYSLSPMPKSQPPAITSRTSSGDPVWTFTAILPSTFGPWYNGDMPKAANNWGCGKDSEGGAQTAKAAVRNQLMTAAKGIVGNLHSQYPGLISSSDINYIDDSIFGDTGAATIGMTEADWEAWYNGSSTDSANELNNTKNAIAQAAAAHASDNNGGQSSNQGSGSQGSN